MNSVISFFQKIWTASIRRQLMLGIILVHAVLMSIFVYDLVERQRAFLHTQSVEQAKGLAKTLAVNSATWVLANDVVGLEEILSAQTQYPSLRYAMVLSPKGQVLGHTEIEKVGLFLSDAISRKLLMEKQDQLELVNDAVSVDIASRIISNGVFIGWARVSLSQEENAKSLQIITRDGLIYTVLAIVIGALFAFFMAKGITRGLKHLVDVAEGIKEGNQALRADISRHDEIGKLGEDFNLMLDALNKSKGDLQAVMDNSPAVIYAKDKEGRYIFINQRWATLFDKDKKGIVGKTDHEIFDKDFADKFTENDSLVLKTGEALRIEEYAPHDDGTHTYLSVKFPLRDENNHIYAMCGISTDITESINIKNEKAFLEKQLLHTQKMQAIGQLTGGIAHDFNNLLAVILGYGTLSKDRFAEENETLSNYLDNILTAGIRGKKLIEQMMIYSRKDQTSSDIEPMNLESALIDTIKMLKATIPTSIKIDTNFQKNIPYIKSNEGLISQVFLNLCMNAKDSMGETGHLLITLDVEDFNHESCTSCHEHINGEYVVIGINDSGKGIEDDVFERMFEPFFTSKNIGEGTGMGLSVVHGIVHKLDGHIVVKSKLGEGSSFKILLPISNENIKTENSEKVISEKYDFSNLTIMVVDDEPGVAHFLEDSLTLFNAKVEVFTSSTQAFAYFEEYPDKFDIVITDQAMPDLTGIALSEKLLAIRPEQVIILCTGYSVEVTEESALQLGIKSLLHKPLEIKKLYNIINEIK